MIFQQRQPQNVVVVVVGAYFFFGEAAAFFAGDAFAAATAAAVVGLVFFGLGALGFLVGEFLAVFFAFDGDFGDFDAAAAATLPATFFSTFLAAFARFSLAADAAAFFFLPAAVDAVAALPAAVGDAFLTAFGRLAPAAADVLTFAGFLGLPLPTSVAPAAADDFADAGAASLNDPDAPLPFVCTNTPESTAFFRYLRINGDTFSASTL